MYISSPILYENGFARASYEFYHRAGKVYYGAMYDNPRNEIRHRRSEKNVYRTDSVYFHGNKTCDIPSYRFSYNALAPDRLRNESDDLHFMLLPKRYGDTCSQWNKRFGRSNLRGEYHTYEYSFLYDKYPFIATSRLKFVLIHEWLCLSERRSFFQVVTVKDRVVSEPAFTVSL